MTGDGYSSTPGETFEDHRHRAYPFPMPQSSLPSMRSDQLGAATSNHISSETGKSKESSIKKSTAGHLLPGMPATDHTTLPDSTQGSPVTLPNQNPRQTHMMQPPASQGNDTTAGPSSIPAPPRHVQPTIDLGKIPTPSSYSLREAYGQVANKSIDQIDAHDLVSLWCAKEDEEVQVAPVSSTPQLAASAPINDPSGRDRSISHESRVIQDAHLCPDVQRGTEHQTQSWSQARKILNVFLPRRY
jgi:hypothetical protein